ncbi:hypothetical protein DFH11DRAFT_368132 [Phellopilus nigrolimitatus]|nr:hypothetical protein DFH11DRAFT_368132 [Phellopilus nigrolimitatus]
MHINTVFTHKEIRSLVFSLNSRQDNARCARVRRLWKDVALDLVWEKVDGLLALMKLLAPMKLNDHKKSKPGQVSDPPEVRKSSPTLDVLVSLAERCPQITHLRIPIDLDTVPPPTLGLPTAFTGLRDLHLDYSPLPQDLSRVTIFLGKVLSVDCDVYRSDCSSWKCTL